MSETENTIDDVLFYLQELETKLLENQNDILDNQAQILEKLDNLSRPGSDYSVDEIT